jgi:hypothetical protein
MAIEIVDLPIYPSKMVIFHVSPEAEPKEFVYSVQLGPRNCCVSSSAWRSPWLVAMTELAGICNQLGIINLGKL